MTTYTRSAGPLTRAIQNQCRPRHRQPATGHFKCERTTRCLDAEGDEGDFSDSGIAKFARAIVKPGCGARRPEIVVKRVLSEGARNRENHSQRYGQRRDQDHEFTITALNQESLIFEAYATSCPGMRQPDKLR